MCVNTVLRIQKISGNDVRMEDGRVVRLGMVQGVAVGDFLEVIADLALAKVDPKEAGAIQRAQGKRRIPA